MSKTYSYVRYDEQAVAQQNAFRAKFEELEAMVLRLVPGRASALVGTKLEEAYMWVGKSIRDEQYVRDAAYGKETIEQEDRDPDVEPKGIESMTADECAEAGNKLIDEMDKKKPAKKAKKPKAGK